MKVFYHTDSDGFCSGALIRIYCDLNHIKYDNSDFIPINYGWKFPFDQISKDEEVFIVDFSLENVYDMDRLTEITKNIHWIDHHISAIRKYENTGFDKDVPGIRYNGVAGCLLTWLYLFKLSKGEIKFDNDKLEYLDKAPTFVKYISDHDVWEFKYGDSTKYFQTALRSEKTRPTDQIWDNLFYDNLNRYLLFMLDIGKTMYTYKCVEDENYLKRCKFDTIFEGFRTCAVNRALCNSSIFDTLENRDDYELFMTFSFDGEKFRYTIYPNNKSIDVSKIANKYGGGGHAGAAGFSSYDLLIRKNKWTYHFN